jgi:hypothetical protein
LLPVVGRLDAGWHALPSHRPAGRPRDGGPRRPGRRGGPAASPGGSGGPAVSPGGSGGPAVSPGGSAAGAPAAAGTDLPVAARRSPGGRPSVRTATRAVVAGPPRGRPQCRCRRGGTGRRAGRGPVRRVARRPGRGECRPRRWPTYHVRANPANRAGWPTGGCRRPDRDSGRRPPRLPGRGVPALGATDRHHVPRSAQPARSGPGPPAAVGRVSRAAARAAAGPAARTPQGRCRPEPTGAAGRPVARR